MMTATLQPNSLAIYIHWPFCKSKCPYCDFNSHVREQVAHEVWKDALLRELEHRATLTGPRRISSIFFGGGTPSLMEPATVQALIDRVGTLWQLSDDAEITLEANPTSVEAEKFKAFRAGGVNRLSLGIQSLRQEELTFLGRQHNVDEARHAIDLAAQHFPRYTFDLIYARPQQTPELWERELGEALALAGDHLSLYQLTIEENTAFHHAYHTQHQFTLPDEDEAAALYEVTQEMMEARGMPAYEVSNHAKVGQESRHNLAYWRYEDTIGIGPGAHGRLTLADGARVATQTIKSPERWLERVTADGHAHEIEPLPQITQIEECVMMGLRLREGISRTAFLGRVGVELHDVVNKAALDDMVTHGLLIETPDRLAPTARGMALLNYVTGRLLV